MNCFTNSKIDLLNSSTLTRRGEVDDSPVFSTSSSIFPVKNRRITEILFCSVQTSVNVTDNSQLNGHIVFICVADRSTRNRVKILFLRVNRSAILFLIHLRC